MFLCSCSASGPSMYQGTQPIMAFDQFFNGPIRGWGLVQNRSGKVIKQFDIDMLGTWQGNQGTLEEHFKYYDGKTMDRVWHITKQSDNSFTARASDIVGEASGASAGTAIKWNYVMRVEAGGSTYNIAFDDWMFQMRDGAVLNRSYMKKFGVRVGEITVFMQKLNTR